MILLPATSLSVWHVPQKNMGKWSGSIHFDCIYIYKWNGYIIMYIYIYIYYDEKDIYIYIWVNYNDLTVLPNLGIMVSKGNHPQMALIQVGESLCFTHIYIYTYTHCTDYIYDPNCKIFKAYWARINLMVRHLIFLSSQRWGVWKWNIYGRMVKYLLLWIKTWSLSWVLIRISPKNMVYIPHAYS